MSEGHMTAEQTPDIETFVAEVLTEHREDPHYPDTCICEGEAFGTAGHYARHVAQALAPVLAATVREARAAALREAALSVPMGPTPDPADYLNACADRIAVDAPEGGA